MEEIRSGRKEGKRFKDEGRVEALHWQKGTKWTRLNNGGIQAGGTRRRRHSVVRCGTSRKSGTPQGEQPQE